MECELLLGNDHERDGGPLHPPKDNTTRFLKREIEEGIPLIAVPFE